MKRNEVCCHDHRNFCTDDYIIYPVLVMIVMRIIFDSWSVVYNIITPEF